MLTTRNSLSERSTALSILTRLPDSARFQDKFSKLLNIMPEIHQMASRGEDHLYHKHCTGGAPTQTLLMEMLHAKRK